MYLKGGNMGGKHKFWEGIYDIKCVRNGDVVWEETKHNALVNEGEELVGDTFLRDANAPTEFYLRFAEDTLTETDTLVDIVGEPVGYGYAPILIERSNVGWPVKELDDGDWRYTSKELSYTASGGDIGPFNALFLATTSDNTGKLISFVALSTERTVLSGDTLLARVRLKFK
jgi:hypothetical protein